MNILVTGAKGFIGGHLIKYLNKKTDHVLYEFNRNDNIDDLIKIAPKLDFVYHLAGVNRSNNKTLFQKVNVDFTHKLCDILSVNRNVMLFFASSTQASNNDPYGLTKRKAEIICQEFQEEYGNKVFIYRLPGIFGEGCKPNYNSVVATFCHNIANDLEIKIIDGNKKIELLYISDLCDFFFSFLKDYDLENPQNMPPTSKIKINELASTIRNFRINLDNNLDEKKLTQFKLNLFKTFNSYQEKNFQI